MADLAYIQAPCAVAGTIGAEASRECVSNVRRPMARQRFTKSFEYFQMRKFIIDMVISTDMALHFGLMAKSRSTRDVFPDIRDWEDVSLILQLMLHLADISNPARPFPRAFAWAEMVVAEFLRQGDEERRLGMPVTSFCDRRLVKMPQSQLGFIRTYLQVTLEESLQQKRKIYSL
ncbi:unnamed protein product [Ostreobium quekettii]|uniref:PDEase domain-containing protein n=1 Tax=Ostreobium quekettii TaxID=121088 RepID=A0A8S1J090_9CHLO|nr:unnamed protein product [Ostreobium quekettii]